MLDFASNPCRVARNRRGAMAVQSPILSPSERGPLGQYLWTLRRAAAMSLREVEEASENCVSNAYLSQLETGRIKNPSPGILHELAAVYESRLPRNANVVCSYEQMMELAGHIRRSAAGIEESFSASQLCGREPDPGGRRRTAQVLGVYPDAQGNQEMTPPVLYVNPLAVSFSNFELGNP